MAKHELEQVLLKRALDTKANFSKTPSEDGRLAMETHGPIRPRKNDAEVNATYENDMRGGKTFSQYYRNRK